MNIPIPHSWLLEHLETDAAPTDIQKQLSLCGPSVERIYEREGEQVYDIEVTTNRVDSMSVRGIAREAAVILTQAGSPAKLKALNQTKPATASQLPLPTIVNNPDLCQRTLGVILKDVQHTPTPEWMAKRLRQIDQNVHDSVIDITNYITHELGHPCHAFDYDKIMALGGQIIIKTAEAGKKFTTLDGVEYTTLGGEIVFENQTGDIIDLPAIKGTANTSISAETKNVLLWIESLDAKKVRFGSMSHAIRTVAAQLNEKNVDPNLAESVLLRGIELYQELCSAQVASDIFDDFPGRQQPTPITVQLSTIKTYLGVDLEIDVIKNILTSLDCAMNSTAETLTVTPPTFRADLSTPADIIEEIARIYGYHNLPSVLMPTPIPTVKPTDTNFHLENRLKHFLADIGWQELYTYSMVSAEVAEQSGYSLTDHLKLQNPLTDDKVYLRRSLVPSLVEIINQAQQAQLSVFELAHIYEPQDGALPTQQLLLTLVSTQPARTVKGHVEALLDQLHITAYDFKPSAQNSAVYTQQLTLSAQSANQNVELGVLGLLADGKIAVALDMKSLITVAQSHPSYQPIPKTTPIIEDLTFTLPAQTTIGPVIDLIKQASPLIKRVELADQYQQNFTFSIWYHDLEQNLSVETVTPLRKQIVTTIQERFQAQLVGNV